MELDKRQWYVVWFFWSLGILYEFKPSYRNHPDRYQTGTNLCHFIRVLLLWCPLILLLQSAVYLGSIAVLTIVPAYLYGVINYAEVAGGMILGVGVIIGLKFARREIGKWSRRYRAIHPKKERPPKIPKLASAGPSFGEILWTYVVGLKQKVCPIISFNSRTQEIV